MKCRIVFGLFSIILAISLAAESPLTNWLADNDANIWIDPLLNTSHIRRDSDTLVISEGQSWGIFNGTKRVQIPGINWSVAGPEFSVVTLNALSKIFNPPQEGLIDGERRITTIFIDPGHGGKDPGTIGRRSRDKNSPSLQEKDLALTVSLLLRDLLKKAYPGIRVVLSRDTDLFLSLDERTKKANAYARSRDQSVLYISIHANASLNSRAKGFEVWYLPASTRRQVIRPEEYAVDNSVLPLVNDLVEEQISSDSYLLASKIQRGIEKSIQGASPNRGIKEEDWYVVRNSFMPAVLVEMGFVTNPEEFDLLAQSAYLKKLAQGIYSGMDSFIGDYHIPTQKR